MPEITIHQLSPKSQRSRFGPLIVAQANTLKGSTQTREAHARDRVAFGQYNERLKKEANKDPLTGLLNRRGMKEEIRNAMAEIDRKGGSVHLVLADLRGFKNFNDVFGHAVGDEALVAFANELKAHIRPYDKVGRWGGEEFLLLIKNGDSDIAQTIFNRLHDSLSVLPTPFNSIHADMGMVSYRQHDDPVVDMEVLIARADKAMYFAKQHKLTQVHAWNPSL